MATEASRAVILLCAVGVVAELMACSADGMSASRGTDFEASGGSGNGAGSTGGSASTGGTVGVPPETENEAQYLAPVATGKFLWTTNPLSGRVALIDATTLAVTLTTAGDGPTEVVGLPELGGKFGALVLNTRSDDATLFRLESSGLPVKSAAFRTHGDANSWVVSPSGNFAIAWTDARKLDKPDRLQTFQDITLLSLAREGDERVVPLSVGVRPSRFGFDADERHLYVVSEEGISVIELGDEPTVTGLLDVSENSFEDPATRDVNFSPDGSYAVVRNDGQSSVAVVSLPNGEIERIEMGGVVTDLDLTEDGTRAVAVLGPKSEVVLIPLPIAGADPATFPRIQLTGEAIGSVALNADASELAVYSTALATTRVTLLEVGPGPSFTKKRTQDLISPVTALFAAPDPRFAVTFQGAASNSKKAGAFSLLSLKAPRAPKIVATDAAPAQIAFSPSTDAALVTVSSATPATFGAYLIALGNQQVDFVPLESPPLAAGVVPAAGRAYIAQSHPEGRITFVSLDSGELQSLTGFELAARIRQ
ncbi:MAG TPA: hypothetical protein VG937_24855 [Polyangiaceae bacterium]|nr:hypothetical protein [Polyangiaceae bacterium]